MRFDPVERAIVDVAAGRAVVVLDDEHREDEGDLIFAAAAATPDLMAFTVEHTSGYLCVALTDGDATRLDLPPMHRLNQDRRGTAYTVTVDARVGVGTGISATDRARTVALLGSATTLAADLSRPGHVVPLRARAGGVLERPGHTEAAVDLARLAGRHPAGALCEIVSRRDPRRMARGGELRAFADEHGLALISIADLVAHRLSEGAERSEIDRSVAKPVTLGLTRAGAARVPLAAGRFTAIGYRAAADGREHVAFVAGDPAALRGAEDVLVRVHSECLTGDVFGSLRCDCGPQLDAALTAVAAAGRGVVVYLRGHEGRGIGLLAKLQAYELQDAGADTLDANLGLGLPVDARDYGVAAEMLADLGVRSVRIITHNPDKATALAAHGVPVHERVTLPVHSNPENLRYLQTKRDRMGHVIELPPSDPQVRAERLVR